MKIYLASPHSNWFIDGYLSCDSTFIQTNLRERESEIILSTGKRGGGMYLIISNLMNILMAGVASRAYVVTENKDLDIYLAGAGAGNNSGQHKTGEAKKLFYNYNKIYVLESFYYLKDWMFPYIQEHWDFMLDSGAYTFLENAKKGNNIDWDSYIVKYAAAINHLNVEKFLELDIDNVVGLKEVERLRDKLEQLTNKKCIPVWHKKRGLDYYKKMCNDYSYIAIGGIVSGEITSKDYPVFANLLNIARENKTKVHGLGFTNLIGLTKYRFYSVDSTAWIYGNRSGFLYKFNGRTLDRYPIPKGNRLKPKDAAIHNFTEWIKFQKYAKDNL